jgi:hypothetical protein
LPGRIRAAGDVPELGVQKHEVIAMRILMPDGGRKVVDIRALPFYRFEDNESHTEGLYGMVFAGPGLVAPDTRHPHMVKKSKI